MRAVYTRAVALVAAGFLGACVATPAQPVVSTTLLRAAEPPRKVFVLARLGPSLPDGFENAYLAAIERGIGTLGATARTVKISGLELDRTAPEAARQAFAPDVSLSIAFSERSVAASTHRGEVSAQLVDAQGRVLWASRQIFTFTALVLEGKTTGDVGQRAGEALIEKLFADRVFPGPI